ncbi:uncharacterized protein UV8b_04673 [Ustilaginoidea virens]|uniref:Uncharacterized protein n=1 Tax=Ustilaginoidea virens TaxID=1159556 RepID=A0A063C6N3_USTVR|nr:uncharacterized protein UV8b_04673 [Ustilaginoidea virens]QUC20432.1 hypothetical protein UV8b_04673 [Ustilaginoidea virens]GAO15166.1 hypothetical protein UVI_02029360 [Ustilaginoidea virens]
MSDIPHPRHPGYETGISDEAAIEERDLIAQAEDEERRLHPDKSTGSQPANTGSEHKEPTHVESSKEKKHESPLDKVKHVLHLDK